VNPDTHFKGWAKPGPVPPGLEAMDPARAAPLTLSPQESLDAISGHFRLFQLSDGHRFSTDDILTAWYGSSWCPTARRVLDLGSGIGTVGMICAWRLPGSRLVTVEAQAESVALARKSACYNGLTDRYELRGTVADYCATAARRLAPGGFFACVFPHEPAQRARVEAGAREAQLVIVRKRPVVFREGDPPLVALFGLMRAEDLPEWFRGQTWTEPDLIIRTRDGRIHPEYSAVKLAIGFPP